MEFGLSEEQKMLEESVGRFLNDKGTLDRARQFADNNETRADDVWKGLSESGVAGLLIAEEHGGVGLGLLDAAVVAQTLGYHVTPAPFVATAVMVPLAISFAGSDEQKSTWLPKLADGGTIAGAALTETVGAREGAGVKSGGGALNGKAMFVIDYEADLYLVADENRQLFLVEAGASGLTRNLHKTIDKTRPTGELLFDNTPAELLPGSADPEVCARVLDAGRVILAADSLGAAQHMLKKAIAYSLEREQFGRLIGSFQAVKHMCADMAANLEPCLSMMWYAAFAYDERPDEARLNACHAKAHISEVAQQVSKTSTEVHGGIGFTDELGLHYWFKRIGANRQLLGSPEQLREEAARVQELV